MKTTGKVYSHYLSKWSVCSSILICLFISSCHKTYHIKTEEEKQREITLKNKIKSITEYRTEYRLGISMAEVPGRLQNFDNNAFLIREVDYKSNGSVDCIITYEYDSAGNLTVLKAIDQDSAFIYRETRHYNTDRSRKELYFYLPDGTYKYRNIATYDNFGRMKELAWYWPEGFKSKNVYSWIEDLKTEDTEYGPNGKFRYQWKYIYDKNGNMIEAVQRYPGNAINSKTTWEYDNDNRLISKTDYIGEAVQRVVKYQYGSNNLLAKRTELSPTGRILVTYRYHYEFRQ